jgi:hypothetical protein
MDPASRISAAIRWQAGKYRSPDHKIRPVALCVGGGFSLHCGNR